MANKKKKEVPNKSFDGRSTVYSAVFGEVQKPK